MFKIIKCALVGLATAATALALPFGRSPVAIGSVRAAWIREGTVLGATTNQSNAASTVTCNPQEASVKYEGNPVILTGKVWKKWYTAGWTSAFSINYAESYDGLNWVPYSGNPVITNHNRSDIVEDAGTYYIICSKATTTPSNAQLDLYSSSDGVTQTLVASNILPRGTAPTYDDDQLQSSNCIKIGSTWYMYYEAHKAGDYLVYMTINLATATSLAGPWTKSASNPLIQEGQRPWVYNPGNGVYWMVLGIGTGSPSVVEPFQIYLYKSTDLVTWVQVPGSGFTSSGMDEGVGVAGSNGFIADPYVVEVAGNAYLYYTAGPDNFNPNEGAHLKRAVIHSSLNAMLAYQFFNGNPGDAPAIVNDTFTDTNGMALTAHAISPLNQPSGSWSQFSGGWTATIQSNAAAVPGAPGDLWVMATDMGVAQGTYHVDLPVLTTSEDRGIMWRGIDLNNLWETTAGGNGCIVLKRVAGVQTLVCNYSSSPGGTPSGHVTSVDVYSSRNYAQIFFNGVTVATIYDSDLSSATKAGFLAGGSASQTVNFDNFTATATK